MVRDPFTADVTSISDDVNRQSELLALQTDGDAKMKFEAVSLSEFWSSIGLSYPRLQHIAIRELLPFGSTHVYTYLCETAFTALLHMKSKIRIDLDVQPDLRCCLPKTEPQIEELVKRLQLHASY